MSQAWYCNVQSVTMTGSVTVTRGHDADENLIYLAGGNFALNCYAISFAGKHWLSRQNIIQNEL